MVYNIKQRISEKNGKHRDGNAGVPEKRKG